uniref:Uncharacterized protein n=1 Tax=Anguilla anguilla TaxID=7936 RepID=A0A0E9UZ99_ANGAN
MTTTGVKPISLTAVKRRLQSVSLKQGWPFHCIQGNWFLFSCIE